nr:unnamed protein product [Digitaria exilis]
MECRTRMTGTRRQPAVAAPFHGGRGSRGNLVPYRLCDGAGLSHRTPVDGWSTSSGAGAERDAPALDSAAGVVGVQPLPSDADKIVWGPSDSASDSAVLSTAAGDLCRWSA